MNILASLFADVANPKVQETRSFASVSELAAWLLAECKHYNRGQLTEDRPGHFRKPFGLGLFSVASFRPHAETGVGHRNAEHVDHVYMLGLDFDGLTPEQLEPIVTSLFGRSGLLFTTFNHAPTAPSLRALLVLSRPVTSDEYRRLWTFVAPSLGVDPSTCDPCRQWFMPATHDGNREHFNVWELTGAPLDVDALLASSPVAASSHVGALTPLDANRLETAAKMLAACWPAGGTGQGLRHRAQLYLAGGLAKDGWTKEQAIEILHAVCTCAGADDRQKRVATVSQTYASHAAGREVGGWGRLNELVPQEAIDAFKNTMDPALRTAFQSWDTTTATTTTATTTTATTPPPHRTQPGHWYSIPSTGDLHAKDLKELKARPLATLLQDLSKAHPEPERNWAGRLQYNEFADTFVAVNPPLRLDAETRGEFTDTDVTYVCAWFEHAHQAKVQPQHVRRALEGAAKLNTFNPVREYLEAVPSADVGVFEEWAVRMGAKTALAADILKKFAIGAVRRALATPERPVRMDYVLVLHGKEGEHKSSFVPALFGDEFSSCCLADLTKKDAMEDLRGVWGIEISELATLLRAEPERVKDFFARTTDRYRDSYGRRSTTKARRCVFVGTTNDGSFLRGADAHRRFWPISVSKIDLEWLRENRDRIWGAAYALHRAGEPHWYEDETTLDPVRELFRERDAWHDKIETYLRGRAEVASAGEVYTACIATTLDLKSVTRRETNRVADVMRKLGWREERSNGSYRWRGPGPVASEGSPALLSTHQHPIFADVGAGQGRVMPEKFS